MSFFLMKGLNLQRNSIKPLHAGFGFGAKEILLHINKNSSVEKELSKKVPLVRAASVNLDQNLNSFDLDGNKFSQIPSKTSLVLEGISNLSTKNLAENQKNRNLNKGHLPKYYVHPFSAFLSWTVDAFLGFCFLIISLCVSYVFIPRGFLNISNSFAHYISMFNLNIDIIHTFLFSLQIWFFMATLVFVFQFIILIFEGATLGRWLFGITIQNHKDKNLKVSVGSKICAALSEALLLGGILSFVFIVIFPSRVPIFFWMRYSSQRR